MTVLSYLSKTNDNKMASASASDLTSMYDESNTTFDVNDHIIPFNKCRCHRCRLDNVLEALPRQMNQYIKMSLPENLQIYRRINSLIDRIIELMCPKDYSFIRKDYPWDWFEAILEGIRVEDIFIRWQMAIHPDGREVSIFVDLESYEKAAAHFEEIRAILFPIFKGVHEAEEGVCHYIHPYVRDSVRQDIVRKCWEKFLKAGTAATDSSSVDSDELPALEEVSDIEFNDEGEIQILETTRVEDLEDEDSESDEDEDDETEAEDDDSDDSDYEDDDESEEGEDEDEDSDDEKESLQDKLPEVLDSTEIEVETKTDSDEISLDKLFKQGKIKVVFNNPTDNIKGITWRYDGETDEILTGIDITFVVPISKVEVLKNMFKTNLEGKWY
jgi:hypothetical protein